MPPTQAILWLCRDRLSAHSLSWLRVPIESIRRPRRDILRLWTLRAPLVVQAGALPNSQPPTPGATPLPVMGTTVRLNHINSESFNLGQRVRQTGAPHSSCCRQPSRCSANLTINSQSAANFSHASLSNGLKAFSARWRHSSAICRYFSASLTQIKPRTDAIYVKSRGARSFLKTGQCYFQNQPLGSETGQYPQGLPAAGAWANEPSRPAPSAFSSLGVQGRPHFSRWLLDFGRLGRLDRLLFEKRRFLQTGDCRALRGLCAARITCGSGRPRTGVAIMMIKGRGTESRGR